MSTFAVFGMTKHRAIELARKKIEPWNKAEKRPMTPAEYEAAVEAEAKATMESGRSVQLSEKFDAPSFAKQFMELARKGESRNLHVRAFTQTGNNPKTGRPVFGWSDYKG